MERRATQTGLRLPDDVKIAIVRRRAPDALRHPLQLTANAYEGKYFVFHDAVDAFWKARQGCGEDQNLIDVSFVAKGGPRGQSKGGRPEQRTTPPRVTTKGFGRGKPPSTQRASTLAVTDKSKKKGFFCERKGHLSRVCRTGRVCYNCHKQGHTMKQCTLPRRNVQQVDVEEQDEDDDETKPRVLMIQFWKLFIEDSTLRVGSMLMIAIDSGSEVHVIPYYLVKAWTKEFQSDVDLRLRGAGREELKHYGRLRITLKFGQVVVTNDFEVAEVRRAIFSVGIMEEHGWRVILDKNEKVIVRAQMRLPLIKKGTSLPCGR